MIAFGADDAARLIAVPRPGDDKYSRGVLGVATGSERYPGAAVLSVEGALRTGLGMVRYVGPRRATDLVLEKRPEVVPGAGRSQAWLIGSGIDPDEIDPESVEGMEAALGSGAPVVIDAGALDRIGDAVGAVVITPHHGELARLLGVDRAEIDADPAAFAQRAAERYSAVVVLKGHETHIAGGGEVLRVRSGPPWVATAGAGDVLGGVIGAIVATNPVDDAPDPVAALARLAAAGAVIHGLAGHRASAGGPVVALDIARAVPAVVAELVAGGRA